MFSWPLAAIVVSAMIIFSKPIVELIRGVNRLKPGVVSITAKASHQEAEIEKRVRAILGEFASSGAVHLDIQRLVIRDTQGRPRIIASTVEVSGEPFLALIDEEGDVRASLSASSATDPTGVAMLMFLGGPPCNMAAFIAADSSAESGAVGIRDSSGIWKEMP
jgi:hypothetical protein